MKSIILWILVALLGAFAFATLALSQGETVNALWLIVAAVSTYAIAYRFYSKFIAERVMELNDRRLTPAERHNDGLDYVPTHKWVLFGHHFAAIAGAGEAHLVRVALLTMRLVRKAAVDARLHLVHEQSGEFPILRPRFKFHYWNSW